MQMQRKGGPPSAPRPREWKGGTWGTKLTGPLPFRTVLTFLTIAATVSSSLASSVVVVVVVSRSATPRYRLLTSCFSNAARSVSVLRLRKVFGTAAAAAAVAVTVTESVPPAAASSFAAINPGTDDDFGIVRLLEIGTGICEEEDEEAEEDPLEGMGEAVPPDVGFDELDEADRVRR